MQLLSNEKMSTCKEESDLRLTGPNFSANSFSCSIIVMRRGVSAQVWLSRFRAGGINHQFVHVCCMPSRLAARCPCLYLLRLPIHLCTCQGPGRHQCSLRGSVTYPPTGTMRGVRRTLDNSGSQTPPVTSPWHSPSPSLNGLPSGR